MAKVTDTYASSSGKLVVLCDCTPPRSGDPAALDRVGVVDADYICVAYNPGKLARADSVAAAHTIRDRTGKDVVFNMATRDMNKVAMQSRLLGAQMMGLENVVTLQGDSFTEAESELVKTVDDFTPTGLVEAIAAMNAGQDYRGTNLRGNTDFCIGATLDLARDLEREVWLTHRKVEAGAHYFNQCMTSDSGNASWMNMKNRQAGRLYYLSFGDCKCWTRMALCWVTYLRRYGRS